MKTAMPTGKRETAVNHTWLPPEGAVMPTRRRALDLAGAKVSRHGAARAARRHRALRPAGGCEQKMAPRNDAHPQPADSAFHRSFAPRRSSARMLRNALTVYLDDNGIDDPDVRQIVLCADEALINAIEHAGGDRVVVSAQVHGDELGVEVVDGGCGFDPATIVSDSPPDPTLDHGRGLFLIRHLMDDVEIISDNHGTTFRMRRHLTPKEGRG
jgi:serine/threonine-protein kinase RsbW